MLELKDVFLKHSKTYKQKYNLSQHTLKTIYAIENCRSSILGAHQDTCNECGYIKISYNSCRNRHCPKCQTVNKEKWINDRKFDVLNTKYFHVVFTVPKELKSLIYQNQKIGYNILFKSVSETLQELGMDKKYIGAQIGLMAVLHTWGQNLSYHPHIHCIIPAGGLDKLSKWKDSKKKFFIPVKVLSRKFRGKLLDYIKKAKLEHYNGNKYLENPRCLDELLSSMYNKEWVVYCKPPFKNANYVIEYLGRYTHRVAISNNRLLTITDKEISFKYRDYADENKMKIMTLEISEFIRRFLMHILPPQFMKIRHYGLLGNRNKHKKLNICKMLTGTKILQKIKIPTLDILRKIFGEDFNLCPYCKKGYMIRSP